MSESRPRWTRVVFEATVIVGSILLAFAIDAWWDGVQEDREERAAIGSLLEEFEANLGEIETVEEAHRDIHDAAIEILDIGYGVAEPDTAFRTHASRSLAVEYRLDISTYALDSYLSITGDRARRIPELRGRVAEYRSLIDQVWQQEDMTRELVRVEIARAVAERSEILLIGTGSRDPRMIERRERFTTAESVADLLALVRDPYMRNLVAARIGREWVAFRRTERLRDAYDALIPMLREGAGR